MGTLQNFWIGGVPNVYFGLGLKHEADLLVLHQNRRFYEVEIKVSKHDLIKDLEKEHGHKHKLISRLIYAVPDYLEEIALKILPKTVGIIVVSYCSKEKKFKAKWLRINKFSTKKLYPDQKTIQKFLELGCMRIWTLKQKLLECRENKSK